MKSRVIDRKGSPFCAHPIQNHKFSGAAFECHHCGEPRARHYEDGFIPSHSPSRYTTDPAARYRGPHPMFSRPGKERFNAEDIKITPGMRAYAAKRRAMEAQSLSIALSAHIMRPKS